MNAAKSILALSLYLARKADMELAEVTEEDNNKRSKEENGNDTKTERGNRTEPETGVPVLATSGGNLRRKGVRSSARKCKGSE